MKHRKKVYKEFVELAKAEGLPILFSYVELKKDPLLLAKAKNKMGALHIEYVENSIRPYGAFQSVSLSKGYESPDVDVEETRLIYISYGFHATALDLIATFLEDCSDLSKLFSLG
jgi:hypothetical protein